MRLSANACLFSILALLFSCNLEYTQKKYKIGFSQCTGADAWRRQMLLAMQRELAFHADLELIYKDAENGNAKQISDIEEFIESNVDLIIVSPNEADPITPVVEKALQKGIPTVIVDRRTSSSLYTAYVGADNYEIGKLAGDHIAQLLKGHGRILEIWGLKGSSPAIDRHRGLTEIISKYPEISIVGSVEGEWEVDTVKSKLGKSIGSLPEFDLVFAHNDIMAFGAHTVLRDRMPQNQIKLVGVDGLPGPGCGLQFVHDKILTSTFLYPTGGEEAIRIASQILHQESYEKENILHSMVIDSKNIRIMKLQTDKILNQQKDIVHQQEKISEQIQIYNNQRMLIYILLASLVVTIVVGAWAINSWHEKSEMNKRLISKGEEILDQRNKIAEMAKKLELTIQEKLRFFTDISHEFKTPLTLIIEPTDELLSRSAGLKTEFKEDLLLIKKNALRMLRLVNQLMDFRKIEDRKMILQTSELDIVSFIVDIMAAFRRVAEKRNIDFKLVTDLNEVYLWFDPDKLDKVIFNLLSNAFKFTNDNGRILISISIEETRNQVVILVEDNGLGMSSEQVSHAFDSFYTGDGKNGATGFGLSLSKEYIDLHHGELFSTSEKGKGSRFCILLPLGKEHLLESQVVPKKTEFLRDPDYNILLDSDSTLNHSSVEPALLNEHTVLLIDNNQELRQFIRKRLEGQYTVYEAQDGILGLHLAFEVVPDIIICDVVLPGKDGFSVATELKTDLRTSHIPIVILTAKDSIDQQIAGVQTGADEYITKPFVFEYLSERIKALIKNRQSLKEHYSHDIDVDRHLTFPGGLDRRFVNDFLAIIEKNISNSEFNVNDIVHDLGLSRVQVYRKVKALLGYSVNDYLINVRLKKAKHLLLETDKTIAEIAYEVGFSSPAYFSTVFKSKLNISPKDLKRLNPSNLDTMLHF